MLKDKEAFFAVARQQGAQNGPPPPCYAYCRSPINWHSAPSTAAILISRPPNRRRDRTQLLPPEQSDRCYDDDAAGLAGQTEESPLFRILHGVFTCMPYCEVLATAA
eukprot:COSAG05_NODE_932_length_6542_cov_8.110818_5_plen_107_part_00